MTGSARRYRTLADLDYHKHLIHVARVTGRTVFGQLWQPDPTLDDILYVVYHPAIVSQLNAESPIYTMLRRHATT